MVFLKLKPNTKFINKTINHIVGFSLIEVSIVLIIIGLLVSGIVGAINLIDSSKVRGFIGITYDWQSSVNAFYSIKGRLPGNLKNSYFVGELYNSNWVSSLIQSYTLKNFGITNYDGADKDTVVSYCAAFWLDMYLAKVNDFKPLASSLSSNCDKDSVPMVFSGELKTVGPKTILFKNNKGSLPPFRNAMMGVYFQFVDNNFKIKPKLFYYLDRKIDDGLYDDGLMRSFCYNSDRSIIVDYSTAITSGYKCHDFYYKLIDYKML